MQLFCTITAKSGQRVPLSLENTDLTPTQLRQTVSDATKIPLKDLRLIFRGRMIKDDDSISSVTTEYKLEEGSVLHCMGKPVEDSSNSTTENASAAATTPDTTTVPNRTVVPPLSTATTTPVVAAPSAAAASSTSASFASNRGHNPLSNALMRLKQNNPLSVYATAVGTLDKVLTNIVNNPMEEKYRKVKKNNAAFGKRLGKLVGGHDCMLGAGFVVEHQNGEEIYQFHASATKWGALLETKKTVSGAAKQAKEEQEQAKQRPSAGFGTSAVPVPSSNPGMGGGFAPPNMNDPNMQNMMSQMMNNPEALGQALQNPMVQQMMQNDPNVSPMMRQYMESMANNPAMMQQMAQRMQNPAVRAQLQRAMQQQGGGMPGMGGMPSTGTTPSPSSSQPAPPPQPQNDQGQTEEEMIAEAIRRSLEDN